MDKKIRRFVQICFTAVTNGYLLGFAKGNIYQGNLKKICLPGLNCYSCPGALGSCPIGSLQAVIGGRSSSFSFYVVGFLLLFGALFGRFICGWLCPFGLVQELFHKIPVFKKHKNLPGHKYLIYLKYLILAFFVILLPLMVTDVIGQGSPWFCKYICPSGTLMGGWTLSLLNPAVGEAVGWLFTWKSVLLITILLLSMSFYRPFCKYLCPLGAIYGLFNPIAFYRFRIDADKCDACGKCKQVCPMDIPVYQSPNNRECIRCGKCRADCPNCAIRTTVSSQSR